MFKSFNLVLILLLDVVQGVTEQGSDEMQDNFTGWSMKQRQLLLDPCSNPVDGCCYVAVDRECVGLPVALQVGGGSIIFDDVLLTAAYCLYEFVDLQLEGQLQPTINSTRLCAIRESSCRHQQENGEYTQFGVVSAGSCETTTTLQSPSIFTGTIDYTTQILEGIQKHSLSGASDLPKLSGLLNSTSTRSFITSTIPSPTTTPTLTTIPTPTITSALTPTPTPTPTSLLMPMRTLINEATVEDALNAIHKMTSKTSVWNCKVQYCAWSGIACFNGKITEMRLEEVLLAGTFPLEVSVLIDLTILYVNDNQIFGTIPTQVSGMENLQNFLVWYNGLTGTLPTQMSTLIQLGELLIYRNKITGTLPPEYSTLSKLKSFWLNNNMIEGTVPPEYSQIIGWVISLYSSFILKFEMVDNVLVNVLIRYTQLFKMDEIILSRKRQSYNIYKSLYLS